MVELHICISVSQLRLLGTPHNSLLSSLSLLGLIRHSTLHAQRGPVTLG